MNYGVASITLRTKGSKYRKRDKGKNRDYVTAIHLTDEAKKVKVHVGLG